MTDPRLTTAEAEAEFCRDQADKAWDRGAFDMNVFWENRAAEMERLAPGAIVPLF